MIPFMTEPGEKVHYRPGNDKPENGIFVKFADDGLSAFVVYHCPDWRNWRGYTAALTPLAFLHPGHIDDLPGGFFVGERVHNRYSGENGITLHRSDQNKQWIVTKMESHELPQHFHYESIGKGWIKGHIVKVMGVSVKATQHETKKEKKETPISWAFLEN